MRTQLVDPPETGVSYLEQLSSDGMTPERTLIESFPFLIGRDETTDFQINSGRVSREHAVIRRDGAKLRIEDLGSTNGTFVNGKRIEAALLDDGDIVVIADVEFTFGAFGGGPHRETVTQVITQSGHTTDPDTLIREVRRLQEIITHDTISPHFDPIVEIATDVTVAFEATASLTGDDQHSVWPDGILAQVECRLTERLYQAIRRASVREAASLPQSSRLLLSLHASEVDAESLVDSVDALDSSLAGHRQLIVAVPEEVYSNVDYFDAFHERMRARGVAICCDQVREEHAALIRNWKIAPELLRLANSTLQHLNHSEPRRTQVNAIADAARSRDIEMIAMTTNEDADMNAFCQLGCRYGQGAIFRDRQPEPVHD